MSNPIKLNDNKWNGRWGYDSYFVPGTREDVEEVYKKRLKPQPQESPKLVVIGPVDEGEELLNIREEKVEAPQDGFRIRVERWAV